MADHRQLLLSIRRESEQKYHRPQGRPYLPGSLCQSPSSSETSTCSEEPQPNLSVLSKLPEAASDSVRMWTAIGWVALAPVELDTGLTAHHPRGPVHPIALLGCHAASKFSERTLEAWIGYHFSSDLALDSTRLFQSINAKWSSRASGNSTGRRVMLVLSSSSQQKCEINTFLTFPLR